MLRCRKKKSSASLKYHGTMETEIVIEKLNYMRVSHINQ